MTKGHINLSKALERRIGTRLRLSLPITLYVDRKVESYTKNVCAGGVYFELNTNDLKPFYIGETIVIEIVANSSTTRIPVDCVMLSGRGVVVRTEEVIRSLYALPNGIRDNKKNTKKICVALRFVESLEVISTSLIVYDLL